VNRDPKGAIGRQIRYETSEYWQLAQRSLRVDELGVEIGGVEVGRICTINSLANVRYGEVTEIQTFVTNNAALCSELLYWHFGALRE
jgi:hypothetical protein